MQAIIVAAWTNQWITFPDVRTGIGYHDLYYAEVTAFAQIISIANFIVESNGIELVW